VDVIRAGLVPYEQALARQRVLHEERVADQRPDTVLLLEHPSVYTAGRRTLPEERPFDDTPVIDTDRGGKITWHGPGQLVGYPIIGLTEPLDVVNFVRRLEESLIKVCADLGLETGRIDGHTIPMVASSSVQFIWSFDSFVHIEPDITTAYMAEFARVLSSGGRCVIHHPGTPCSLQRLQGGRSALTRDLFARLASNCGLTVRSQVDCWGPGGRSNTRLFADCVSTLEKPVVIS